MDFQVYSQERCDCSGRSGMIIRVADERHGGEATEGGRQRYRDLPEAALERYLQIPTYLRWGRKLPA